MSDILQTAKQFFDACESGQGWNLCRPYCTSDATFASQTTVLSNVRTLEAYCEWMKIQFTTIPDGHYELNFFAADQDRKSVAALAVFHGTQTGEGGPVPPTGRKIASDYAYHIQFSGDQISHVTKIWNDEISRRQLGWA